MNKSILTSGLPDPVSRVELIEKLCTGKSVLDIGCVEHSSENAENSTWLHKHIKKVASRVVGVDYLYLEVERLKNLGYEVLCADVTKPIPTEEKFEIIIIGNLIEHLSNFDGLFENIHRCLIPGGTCLISTANPFYREQYFYSAFKNDIIVNPEHTCWICPITLDQLASRFNLVTRHVYWAKEKWSLGKVIAHSDNRKFDMYTGRWVYSSPPGFIERMVITILPFSLLNSSNWKKAERKHGTEDVKRLIYNRLIGALFNMFWIAYNKLIITAPINRYELFISELTIKK